MDHSVSGNIQITVKNKVSSTLTSPAVCVSSIGGALPARSLVIRRVAHRQLSPPLLAAENQFIGDIDLTAHTFVIIGGCVAEFFAGNTSFTGGKESKISRLAISIVSALIHRSACDHSKVESSSTGVSNTVPLSRTKLSRRTKPLPVWAVSNSIKSRFRL